MRIILAVTGASGVVYAERMLRKLSLHQTIIERCALIVSDTAHKVWEYELGISLSIPEWVQQYDPGDFWAPVASGSAGYDAMIVCPCSMGTLGRIAGGISDGLITRAADVMLKERKKLILVPRESPLNDIHLENMLKLSKAGALIMPASPSFYMKPADMNELVAHFADRVLDAAGLPVAPWRWGS